MFVGATTHFYCEIILLRHQFCRNYKTGNTEHKYGYSREPFSLVFFLYMFNLIVLLILLKKNYFASPEDDEESFLISLSSFFSSSSSIPRNFFARFLFALAFLSSAIFLRFGSNSANF